MFAVFLSTCSRGSIGKFTTFITRDSATYNCPCVNTEFRRSSQTVCNNCSCDLFTIIIKHRWTGRCLRINVNTRSPSKLFSKIRAIIRNGSSWLSPYKCPTITYYSIWEMIICNPLLKLFILSKFRNNMKKTLIFNNNFDNGKLVNQISYNNFTKYSGCVTYCISVEFWLNIIRVFPYIQSDSSAFISYTPLFNRIKTSCQRKKLGFSWAD